jgi:DNA adenine methylase
LNRYCFNGLYRTNLQGKFNVPFGRDRTGHLPGPEHLRLCARMLTSAEILSCDYKAVVEQAMPGDFVYLDPPYVTDSRRVFNEYNSASFSAQDVKALRGKLEEMHSRGVDFLVSYTACEEARFLANGFYTERANVRRSIAGFAKQRVQRQEFLISSRRPSQP